MRVVEPQQLFTYRRARSGALLAGVSMVLVVETAALDVWLAKHHPYLAWAILASSLATLAWLVADYRAMGRGAILVGPEQLEIRIGRRFSATVPRDQIVSAIAPTWRQIPTSTRDYLNATKPATPNALLTFRELISVRLPGGFSKRIRRLGLCVDEPERFLAALEPALPHNF